ncbi:hypothetical protein ASC99_34030 [Kitasatospora sp. Root107]|nr:DUF4328 domain-containing protein [Kitasatospora sp. Root107]KQV12669.1 hypothetical protein ASC99_34030 [Kitasatospora sp. Root107]
MRLPATSGSAAPVRCSRPAFRSGRAWLFAPQGRRARDRDHRTGRAGAAVVGRRGQIPWDGEPFLGERSAREQGETLAAVNLGLVGAALLCGSGIGITFLVWLNRARHNLFLIPGADPQWAPGWTVGAWFIPLGSFVIGPMVVGDVSRATYAGRSGRAPAGLLTFVWLLLWAPGLAAVGFGSVAEFNESGEFLPMAFGGLAAAVLAIACLLGTVGSVTRVQRQLLGA